MNTDQIWAAVDAQRAGLADLFDTLSDAQWTSPSLCEGWRVRDVAAHLTHSHMSPPRMILEAVKSGFRFDPMIRRLAVSDGRSRSDIAAALRGMVGSRKKVPGTSVVQPLIEVLVHGQDIAVPLGIDWPMPTDGALAAAKQLSAATFPINAAKKIEGLKLVASDADFTVGEGRTVQAPIGDIVMILAGRIDPAAR